MADRDIKGILDNLTNNSSQLAKIKRNIDKHSSISLTGLTSAAKSLFIAFLANITDKPLLIVTSDITKALRHSLDIQILTDENVNFLPSQEASPYELVYSDSAVLKQQLNILRSFKNGDSRILVAPVKSLLNKYLPLKEYEKFSINLKVGETCELQRLTNNLVGLGYNRTVIVGGLRVILA